MFKKILNDDEILTTIRSGKNEDKALEQLYKILLPKVKMKCKKYGMSEDYAYDIFQESILRLYDYIKQGKFNSTYSIEAFVMTIARNKTIDLNRKKKNRPEIEINDFNLPLDLDIEYNTMLTEERKIALEQIFSSIGEKCKELLLLRKYDKRTMTEICEIMGFKSANSAKTQAYKCKQKLIKNLEENPSLANEIFDYE